MKFLIVGVLLVVLVGGCVAFGAAVTAGRYIWGDPQASMNGHLAYGVFWGSLAFALGSLLLLLGLGDYLEKPNKSREETTTITKKPHSVPEKEN